MWSRSRRSARRCATTSPIRRRCAWPARRTSCRRRARSSPTPSPRRSPRRRSRKQCATSRCAAHDQIFRFTEQRRVSVSSAQAAITVRTALESINPSLARKVPTNVLSATTTISQSPSCRHARQCRQVDRHPLHPDVPDRDRIARTRDLEVQGSRARHPRQRHPARRRGRCAAVRHRRGDAGVCRSGRHQRPGARRGGRAVHRRARRPARWGRQGHDRRRPRPGTRTRSRRRRPPAPVDAGPCMVRAAPGERAVALRRWVGPRGARAARPDDPRRRRRPPDLGCRSARALRGDRRLPPRDGRARHRPHHQADPPARGRTRARRARSRGPR